MAKGDPITSPLRVYTESGLPDGSPTIWVDAFFDNVTHALAQNPALEVTRLPTCPWNTLLFGDGPKNILIPEGVTSRNRAQMQAQGFTTLEDILAFQVTLTKT